MKFPRLFRWLVWLAPPLLLALVVRRLPLEDILRVLVSIHPLALAGLIVFNGFAVVFFSSRWWLALRLPGAETQAE